VTAAPRALAGSAALLFVGSAALTIACCVHMSAMGGMPMPGGWTMWMAWMRLPGQSWPGATAAFIGMWVVMMVTMMLPSLLPALARYQRAVGGRDALHAHWLATVLGAGYFLVWALFGLATYPLGVALAKIEMHSPAVARASPMAAGLVVLLAGLLQFTSWKSRQLDCCRHESGLQRALPADGGTAFRHGLHLGLRCSRCCVGPTAILLALGVMDLRWMAGVAAAITVERLAPSSWRAARPIGAVMAVMGSGLMLRAAIAS